MVRDTLGRPIALANVTLKSVTGEVAGHTTSDAQGHFTFSAVAPGTYAVLSDKTGFETGSSIVTLSAGVASTTITLAASQAQEIEHHRNTAGESPQRPVTQDRRQRLPL